MAEDALAKRLAADLVIRGECWVARRWANGKLRHLSVHGRIVSMREAVWLAYRGALPRGRWPVPIECGRADCVRPGHARLLPKPSAVAALKQMSRDVLVTRARVAQTQRTRSVLTEEAVAQIRQARAIGEPASLVAERYRISRRQVYRIESYDCWVPTRLMLSGL